MLPIPRLIWIFINYPVNFIQSDLKEFYERLTPEHQKELTETDTTKNTTKNHSFSQCSNKNIKNGFFNFKTENSSIKLKPSWW